MKQMTFASLALERRRNQTRRERFLAETLAKGAQIKTYIWDDGRLVGLLDHATTPPTLLTLDLDQLGTPRVARNAQGTVVWRWDSDGYGTTLPNEDPDGNGTKTTIHLRFPGQYYDQESGLHYNWHRYYSPRLGRYIPADPIGIEGGPNLYGYAAQNPLRHTDPAGLQAFSLPTLPPPAHGGNSVLPERLGVYGDAGEISFPGLFNEASGSSQSDAAEDQSISPPGNCSATQHRILQDAVNVACKVKRRCDPSQACETLKNNYYLNLRCAQARDEINNTCFGGGNAGHRQAADDARSAAKRCLTLSQQKNCDSCP